MSKAMIGEENVACWLYERRHKAGPAGRGAPWLELPSDVRGFWRDEARAAISAHLAALEAAGWIVLRPETRDALVSVLGRVGQKDDEAWAVFSQVVNALPQAPLHALAAAPPTQNGDEVKGCP